MRDAARGGSAHVLAAGAAAPATGSRSEPALGAREPPPEPLQPRDACGDGADAADLDADDDDGWVDVDSGGGCGSGWRRPQKWRRQCTGQRLCLPVFRTFGGGTLALPGPNVQ